MNRHSKPMAIGFGLVLALGIVLQARQNNTSPAKKIYQQALHEEEATGNLKSAIALYERVLAAKPDRALAAQALVRMAECYQKIGDNTSRNLFERVLREYGDQSEAVATARANLGRAAVASASTSLTTRRVWTTDPHWDWDVLTQANISADGRFLSITNWETGDLLIHEFATGRVRNVTNKGYPYWAEESAISRDGKQVAYSWFEPSKSRYELRIAGIDTNGGTEPRLAFDNEDVSFLMPMDWSPDGNWIALQLMRKHVGEFALFSVRDGSVRVLRSQDWNLSTKVFFSPDGKYIAFDHPAADTTQSDVFTIAIDGSRQTAVVSGPSNDTVMGWSPDGKHVLFASDRTGMTGLWGIAVADGRPQGSPELLKSDIGRRSLGVSNSGNLYVAVDTGDRDIRIASVEFATGKLVNAPVRPIQSFVGSNISPAWSRDGKYLTYISQRGRIGAGYVLGILSAETKQVREFPLDLASPAAPRLTSDGKSVILFGKAAGRQGFYEVDLQTREVKPYDRPSLGQLAPDGKHMYYRKDLGIEGHAYIERDLATTRERELIRRKSLSVITISPDGEFLAAVENDPSAKPAISRLLVIPLRPGQVRELMHIDAPQSLLLAVSWTPDAKGVLVTKLLDERDYRTEVVLVPINGGSPRTIDIGTTDSEGPIQVHPDGRQIAYVSGKRKQDVWVVENFLPSSKTK